MHVVFRESHGLEETETPTDLGQDAADLVVLSLSDSDLGAFAEAWHRGGGPEGKLPSLRLANIAALKHPLSVDTYVEQTLSGAKGILITASDTAEASSTRLPDTAWTPGTTFPASVCGRFAHGFD